jgi:hypothetical protein
LPIKAEDLKTYEAYKKAVRADLPKLSPTSKIKFWIYKDVEFTDPKGKKQKVPAFVVLVDDSHVRVALKSKRMVCTGLTRLEDNQICFEPIKGKLPFMQLKVSVPLAFGKKLYIPKGANPEDESDEAIEDEGEESQEQQSSGSIPTAPPEPPSPELLGAWDKLLKQAQQAVQANPARKDVLTKAMSGIPDLIKSGHNDEAKQRMHAVEELLSAPSLSGGMDGNALKEAWGKLVPRIKSSGNPELIRAAGEAGQKLGQLVSQGKFAEAQKMIEELTHRLDQAKPQETPKPTETSGLTAKDVTGAWQKLAPEMEKKVKSHPELREAVLKARKQVEELTKAGKFEAAIQAVDELAELLHKTSEEAPTHEVESEEENTPPDPRKAEFERKFEQVDRNVQHALKERIGDVSRIRAAVALAQERAETGDYATALRVLVSLETMLEEGENDQADMPVAGLVEYRAKLAAYDSARQRAEQQLDALVAAIPKTVPDEADLGEDVRDEVLEQLDEVQELIDNAVNAANDNKAPVDSALKSQLGKTIQQIEGNKLLEHLESNTFGVPIDIRQTLTKALQEVLTAIPVEV